MDVLVRIKQLVVKRNVVFTNKALDEMEVYEIDEFDVYESILAASTISKTLRSRDEHRVNRSEKLYVIKSRNFNGTPIYTKGTIRRQSDGEEHFYVLISAKILLAD
jgi:hypothetical protein